MRASTAAAALAVLLLAAPRGDGAEFYYALIFASETHPPKIVKTHTFATFVRAVGEGPDPAAYAIEAHTISWLPATLHIRPFAVDPEPGANLTLAETLAYAWKNDEGVSLWGPYQVPAELYHRSVLQFRRLNSGDVKYRAGDSVRIPNICDCIHAVSDIDPYFGRRHFPLIRVGRAASKYIARQVEAQDVNDPCQDHSWLIGRLGLWGCLYEISRPLSRDQALAELCHDPVAEERWRRLLPRRNILKKYETPCVAFVAVAPWSWDPTAPLWVAASTTP
jgi:hypothetical protein